MSEEVLLDLGFLTEEERDVINEVILKDVQMRKLEQSRISRLRKELGELKEDGLPEEELEEKNDRYCARCQTYFGILWNKGALCPRCGQKVCKTCRENVVEEGWVCTLCFKVREVKAQSGAWFFQAQKHKDDKLFGSLLLRKSLRRQSSTEDRQETRRTVSGHKPVSSTDKIHADQQNRNNINYDERIPNKQAEKPIHTSYNKASGDEHYSDISDEDISYEGSHKETFSPREDSEKSSSKDHQSSRVSSDDETEPGDESSRKEADEYEARPGDESPSWKNDKDETRLGNESSMKEADEHEARTGDESPSLKREGHETRPGDETSMKEADEYEARPGDESPSWKREEHETRPGDESSMKEADEHEKIPDDESSNGKEDEYEGRAGDESSNWKAEEYEESHGDESSNWKAEEHEARPDYDDTRAGDSQGVGYQPVHAHQDVSDEAVKPQQDHEIGDTATVNSEVPSTADESSPLDSREGDLLAFSQTFASSVQANQSTRTPRDDLPGSRVTDHGDDRKPADPHHEVHASFNADNESSISETSGYVTPTPSEDTSSKRTPSISGDEGARTQREEYRRKSQEIPPVIITTGAAGGPPGSNRSSFIEYDEDLDVSFSKYEGGLGNRMLKDQLSMGSRESIMSYYSNAGGEVYGKYPVTGDIYFGIKYDAISQELQIQIHQARNIAAVDQKNKVSDPYIKTYLLPDRSRSGKRKSKVKKNTIHPVFDEIITYKISYDEILQRTLWLAVWNHDRFGHNDFLGEVLLPIDQYQQSGFSLEEPDPQWYHLCERQPEDEPMMTYNGEIVVALKYVSPSELVTKKKKKKKKGEEEKGELHVNIIEANDLLPKDANGFSDPFCKSYLLPDKSKKTKQKTAVMKKNLNPKWNYRFVYGNVTQEELMDKVLELTVWDFDRGSSNDFLGGVRLGLGAGLHEWDDSNSDEQAAWNKMLNNQNSWNQVTLTLRDNMGNHNYKFDDVTATDGSYLMEIKPNSEIKGQDEQSLSSQDASIPEEELIRHSEYHHPRASKVAAAITSFEATRSAEKGGQGEKKITLAELAKINDEKKGKEDDPNPEPDVPIVITEDDDVETLSSAKDDENTDSLVRHSEFYTATRSPKPVRRKFSKVQLPLNEHSENRRPTLVDILQKNEDVEGNDGPPGSNLMLKEDLLGSRESIYSNPGLYSDNSVSGEIMFGYQYTNGTLKIKIFEARGLMAIDEKKNTSDPYVKVYLLPDQSRVGKRKTKTKHGTIDPEFNEEMLYKINSTELLKRTIWLTLWHYDRFGRNEFLGEIRIPLGGYNGSEEHAKWYTLLEMLPDSVEEHQGELVVALMYAQTAKKKKKEENTGKLYVKVVEARDLPGKDSDGLSDPFCKSYLLPDPAKKTKKKTPVLKRNLNPHWDHKFTYDDITLEELRNRVLELTVWDHDLGTSNDFLGGVRIGLGRSGEDWDDCEGEEVSLWQFLLSKPNTWTQSTLSLRSQMGSRKGLKISN